MVDEVWDLGSTSGLEPLCIWRRLFCYCYVVIPCRATFSWIDSILSLYLHSLFAFSPPYLFLSLLVFIFSCFLWEVMFLPIRHDVAIEVFSNVSSDFTTHSWKVFLEWPSAVFQSLFFFYIFTFFPVVMFSLFAFSSLLVVCAIYTLGRLRFIDWIPKQHCTNE